MKQGPSNERSGVDAGRASLFAVWRPWPGATHRERWAAPAYPHIKTAILVLILSATLLCAGTPPEFSVKLGGKARSLADIEQLVRDHVVKQKLGFDFRDCKKRVTIDTQAPDSIEVFFTSRDGALALGAAIDKNAKVTRCNVVAVCGGTR